jgi:hypothetical protein
MEIVNSIVSWLTKKRIHSIDLFRKFPHEVQEEWFLKLIESGKKTEWGRKYGYADIKNYEQYKKQVPIQDYESLKKYILRVKQGEQNVLWSTPIKWFAKSSGTTNDKSKFIPVSKESLEDCHYKGGKDLLSIYYNRFPESKLFKGKCVVIGGSSEINQFSPNSYYGDLSSIIIRNLPFWVEFSRVPAIDLTLSPDWETKLDQIAREVYKEEVSNLSGVPSWNLVLLNKILEITGKKNMLQVWPNFELYVHGGVSFKPYKEQYKKLFPSDKITYLETYNASEGFFGIQDDFSTDDMLLMLDYGIFYEFIPMDEIGKSNPKTLALHEVEVNKNYAIVISTNAGLWRYTMGDTVEFTSTSPYKIRVTGRTKHFINAFGEEVIIDNAEKALQVACQKTDAIVGEYTAAPIYMNDKGKGAHEWLIEFTKEPENIDYFTEIMDNALKSVNSDYEAKRYNDLALQKPTLTAVAPGTFYNWMKSRGRLGGQNKVPRLANTREYIDSIKKMLE